MSTVSVYGHMSKFKRSCVGIPAIKASQILRVCSPDPSTPQKLAKAKFAICNRSFKKSSDVSSEVSSFFFLKFDSLEFKLICAKMPSF